MRGSNVVVAQGLIHVLVHFMMQWVKYVTSRTTHEVREAFGRKREGSAIALKRMEQGQKSSTCVRRDYLSYPQNSLGREHGGNGRLAPGQMGSFI